MRKSRFTEEQIIAILREQEAGVATAEVCRMVTGISTRRSFERGKSLASLLQVKAAEQGMERKRARRRSAQEWRGVLAAFADSALSVEQYCQREGISRACFYRWRSILGSVEDRALRHKAPSVANTVAEFVDLGALRHSGARLELRLDLGAGIVLSIARS